MSAALVLVWLGTESARAAREPALASWAAARMVAIEEPVASPRTDAPHDDATAERVEALVNEALTASYSAEPAVGLAAVAAAEKLLADHPELPEAAWLLDEVWRQDAELVKDTNPAESTALLARAAALGGTRAETFDARERRVSMPTKKERTTTADAAGRGPAGADGATAPSVTFTGPLALDRVEVDGAVLNAPFRTFAGHHDVRVLRLGRLIWAGWVDAERDPTTLPLPSAAPCTEADFSAISTTKDGVDAHGALCPHFAVARAAGGDGIEVVNCFGSSCGPWLPWKPTWGAPFEGPAHPKWPEPKNKDWILWTAASVAAVAAGGLILWQEGAFERQGPPHDTFVWVPP